MDTRSKILTLDAALHLQRATLTLVTGYFDALRAVHARDLAALARPLLAAVLPLPAELLPQAARAEMVAAMRVVDYVVSVNESELDELIESLAPRAIVRQETNDMAHVRHLIEHVHRRQIR